MRKLHLRGVKLYAKNNPVPSGSASEPEREREEMNLKVEEGETLGFLRILALTGYHMGNIGKF